MSSNNKMEENAPLVSVTRKENDNSQIYILKAAENYYRMKNESSGKYLTNNYQPNEGTSIIQIDFNQWNDSEKWAFTRVEGMWFRIENITTINASACLASTGSNDGDAVKQTTWSNQDAQLWGLEITDVNDAGVSSSAAESIVFYPTIWGDEFTIKGFGFDKVVVSGVSGVTLKQFEVADAYDVSDLTAGIYFITVMNGDTVIGRYKAIKK